MKIKLRIPTGILLSFCLWAQVLIAGQNDLVHFPDPTQTDQFMNAIIRSIGGLDVSDGSEFACITPAGYVAGALNLNEIYDGQWGIAIWGDDALTEDIDGFHDGEQLRFLYWDAQHDWELELSYDISHGEDVYHVNTLLVIDIVVSIPIEEMTPPIEFGIISLYPNPFNNKLNVKYSLPGSGYVILAIYDINGKEAFSLISRHQNFGVHQISYNNSTLSSGNYFLKLTQNNYYFLSNVVLLK